MAGAKEKKIEELKKTIAGLNPSMKETIKGYKDEIKMLQARIDKSAKAEAKKGFSAETEESKKRITKTGMTEGEKLAIATILGASGPGAVIKAISAVKALPSAAKLLPKLAELGGARAKKAYKSLKSALDVARGKGKATNLPAAGGRGKVIIRGKKGEFSGALSPSTAKIAEVTGKVARSPVTRTAAGAGTAAAIVLALQNAKEDEKAEEAKIASNKVEVKKIEVKKAELKKAKAEKAEAEKAKAEKAQQILDDFKASGRRVNKKVVKASKEAASFDKDKDIFHKIAYGIAQLTGQKPSVKYNDSEKFDDQMEFYGKKRGGKVTAKRPSTKKYAMNRGGMASVRKPTRA